ncbi:hypothetical protein W97_08679 [Coniosporium apollinis CBS 100218]|uniref:CHRD domain-containing protein n=1 Tax=Coniosporium apollinis (strain CBS 100218) TaxID=1168221 RepID=R7Z5X3_CONA1|nr:uncharacterized protein W97_08679 [Coniosporium apollinis CBS 100218]EON69419.1 hypothetical protein W97_08679 [Coniosporium apollinis CBS 100218]
MKATLITSTLLVLGATATPIEYGPPKGGWESIHYPAPPGGWENVKYPPGTGANPANCPPMNVPFTFTNTYSVVATPDQVVNGTTPTGGLPGSSGLYLLGLNTDTNTICYNITIYNFRGEYQSLAITATHLHEAARGASGPPRIAFPNPVATSDPNVRNTVGCQTGPFRTGVMPGGVDTGAAFHVRQIVANPAGFFCDAHSSLAVPGAFRGQIA